MSSFSKKEILLRKFKNLLKTDLIYPEIFEKISIVGFFSKKISSSFNFQILDSFQLFLPKQIHSTKIIEIDKNVFSSSNFFFKIEGDAVLTQQKGLFLGVRTADCIPILITTINGELIGVVHAGWKGSVNKILSKTLEKILNKGFKPEEIIIAMGPHIKVCCYEVKMDVIEELRKNFKNFDEFIFYKNKKIYLDLEKLNYYQALEKGIPTENIWISKDCTFCLNKEYFSYRFFKEYKGFQLGVIGKI